MGKKPRYSEAEMVEAALELLVEGGPARVSMVGVARALGAPSGSVYHRFPSRDLLLAECWLSAVADFQATFRRGLSEYTVEGALSAIRAALDWTRTHPARAQLLLLYRRQDLISGDWPAETTGRAAGLATELEQALTKLADSLNLDRQRVVFAVTEVFMAGVRRHLELGEAIPPAKDLLVLEAATALLRPSAGDN